MAGSMQEAFRNIPNYEGPLKRAKHKISGVTIVATDKGSASVLEKSSSVILQKRISDGKK
jgi:hypothetical protein